MILCKMLGRHFGPSSTVALGRRVRFRLVGRSLFVGELGAEFFVGEGAHDIGNNLVYNR